ncbi:Lrp/AsnC family transcriptional regulator [Mesorhizobium sp. M7A.F.Ca.US.001.04.1.1]|uniref:Lrp/AsnC family transcriptional regulator n=1 Tax=unclassified Mesorhizobium TaxID=325217 RepID=UPI000FCA769E|nr:MULTISPECIES: Lrp/AsnC family transcriptional regulator [unclassified Mesorhizobium]RUY27354.1 Lrp/AsnC family transcriptional regulator [Mesorhizobium sp. M7A.F.Ca.US.001.04.2.1]RUY36327.1 Lrp/AsnC family transcriptional regulator [Mesorhizobium sp. M7A.F.Ca.US.001.04.1.1]
MAHDADAVDRRIIALLQANARESTSNIAKALGVARTTVHERIGRLERTGFIRGYTVLLDRNPFDTYSRCQLMLNVSKQKLGIIVRQLEGYPEIRTIHVVNGECDLLCFAEIPQLEDLEALIEDLSAIQGVENIRSMIILSTKFEYRAVPNAGRAAMHAAAISRGEAG